MYLLDGGVIVHHLDDSVLVTAETGDEVMRLTGELAAGNRVAVVVDLGSIAFADVDTRAFYAEHDAEGAEVATALVATPRIAEFLARRWREDAKPARLGLSRGLGGARRPPAPQTRPATASVICE
jgi:hypothetical protein